jgi:hypothetical protein
MVQRFIWTSPRVRRRKAASGELGVGGLLFAAGPTGPIALMRRYREAPFAGSGPADPVRGRQTTAALKAGEWERCWTRPVDGLKLPSSGGSDRDARFAFCGAVALRWPERQPRSCRGRQESFARILRRWRPPASRDRYLRRGEQWEVHEFWANHGKCRADHSGKGKMTPKRLVRK